MADQEEGSSGARAVMFLLGTLLFGAAAVVFVYKLVQGYQEQIAKAQKPDDTVMAIVAARDLYQGITITEEDLYALEIPKKYLDRIAPKGDVYQSPEHVVGRIPRERILANEFIREERLADADEGIGLNAIIPRGMRAISINVDGGSAVSGFLNPGNYVDVLVTLDPDRGAHDSTTKTLLQAVYVLAVNNRLGTGSKTKNGQEPNHPTRRMRPSVTLAVTPDQAEQLAYAEKKGTITLALRNDLDVSFAPVGNTTASEVLGEEHHVVHHHAKAAPAPEPQGTTLQIIRGSKTTQQTYDKDGNATNKK